MISWASMEMPVFRYVFSQASDVINGNFIGLILLAVWGGLWFLYVKEWKERNKAL